MRSTIDLPFESGGAAIAKQHGLEPEVRIESPDKPKAEALLKDALARRWMRCRRTSR